MMTDFKYPIILICALNILMAETINFGGGTTFDIFPRSEKFYKSYYKSLIDTLENINSLFYRKISNVCEATSEANKCVEDFLLENVCHPFTETVYPVYDKLANSVEATKKVSPTISKDSYRSKEPVPQRVTGYRSYFRRFKDRFSQLKGYMYLKSYDISMYFYNLYFKVVGRVEDFIMRHVCHPLTKAKHPFFAKVCRTLDRFMPVSGTKNEDYYITHIPVKANEMLHDLRKPTSYYDRFKKSIGDSKWNPLSSFTKNNPIQKWSSSVSDSLPSLDSVAISNKDIKSYITNPAKGIIKDIAEPTSYFKQFKNSLNNWSPLSFFTKKKIIKKMSSSISDSLPSLESLSVSDKDFKKYVTNPAKDVIKEIEEPSSYFKRFKNLVSSWNPLSASTSKNPVQKLSSSVSESLPSLNCISVSNKDFKKSVTNPVKDIMKDIEPPSSYFKKGIESLRSSVSLTDSKRDGYLKSHFIDPANKAIQNITGPDSYYGRFQKSASDKIPYFLGGAKWKSEQLRSAVKLTWFTYGVLGTIVFALLYKCMEELAGEFQDYYADIYDISTPADSPVDAERVENVTEALIPAPEEAIAEVKETKESSSQTKQKRTQMTSTQTLSAIGKDSTTQTTQESSDKEIQTDPKQSKPRRSSSSRINARLGSPMVTPII